MQTILTPSLPGNILLDETPVCDALILYQDLPAGKRAMEVLQNLVGQIGCACFFRYRLFSFGALQLPQMHDDAAEHAAKADLILISLGPDAEFPLGVKTWMESWIGKRKNRSCALIALMGQTQHSANEPTSPQAYLQEVARRGRMDFFPHSLEVGRNRPVDSGETPRHRNVKPRPSLWDRLHDTQPYLSGGLNE